MLAPFQRTILGMKALTVIHNKHKRDLNKSMTTNVRIVGGLYLYTLYLFAQVLPYEKTVVNDVRLSLLRSGFENPYWKTYMESPWALEQEASMCKRRQGPVSSWRRGNATVLPWRKGPGSILFGRRGLQAKPRFLSVWTPPLVLTQSFSTWEPPGRVYKCWCLGSDPRSSLFN